MTIGTWVKIKITGGEVGEITSAHNLFEGDITFTVQFLDGSYGLQYDQSDLEPLPFQKGDKVKVISPDHSFVNKQGVIKDCNDSYYSVQLDDLSDIFYEDELSLLSVSTNEVCGDCKGTGKIELLHSVVDCDCAKEKGD